MAWSCSEWLEERRLANEAAQCVASPLLRNICVRVCMHEQAGVWHHIHLVCCYNTTQLLAAASEIEAGKNRGKKKERKFECVSAKQKGKNVL